MTDRDRLYIAACKLPPSAERTEILETVVRVERSELAKRRARRPEAARLFTIGRELFQHPAPLRAGYH